MKVLNKNDSLQYWRNPPDKNKPEGYLALTNKYPGYLVQLVQKYIDPSASILEIGCNVGRNLNALFQSGYRKLAGIEINANAITLMKKANPEMAMQTKIWIAPVESVIRDFEDNSFDLIFTHAVLQHIHPDSEFVFAEIARVAKKFLILGEGEDSFQSGRYFGRFYRPIFKQLGMIQIYQENLTRRKPKTNQKTYWTRIFEKRTGAKKI